VLQKVFFSDVNSGIAVGYSGKVLRTTNGGTGWDSIVCGATDKINSVFLINTNTGFLVGNGGVILQTTNGGINWNLQTSGTTNNLLSVKFVNANTGTAVGNSGTILRTTNGGTNWSTQTSGVYPNFNDVFFSSADIGTAVGASGTILHTTNGGINWVVQPSGTSSIIYSVYFADANTGIAVGISGLVLKTTNGGNNWITQYSCCGNALNSIYLSDANNGTIVGNFGTIMRYSSASPLPAPTLISPVNGAMNLSQPVKFDWNSVPSATSYRIKISSDSLFNSTIKDSTIAMDSTVFSGFPNGYYYWKVAGINIGGTGAYSSVWKFQVNSSGINMVSSVIPKEYKLYNNYPNPFNPTTKIKFDILKNGLTKITVYDMLGREIKTLINENLTAGSYEVEWNATNFSSGIYFYKMTSGNFTSIKKMVLLK
jgi:photosystem II stability/assembly factor-like uncharacterized protein